MDATTIFGTLTALGGAVIAYLLKENIQLRKENVRIKGLLTKAVLAGQELILTDDDIDKKKHLASIKIWEEISRDILAELANTKIG